MVIVRSFASLLFVTVFVFRFGVFVCRRRFDYTELVVIYYLSYLSGILT